MHEFAEAVSAAWRLIASRDPELVAIILLSLRVSLTASVLACCVGAPLGAALAVARFPGRGSLVVVANALLGLPPVVVGLLVYLLLSRSGPLGEFGLLFTPGAMIIAQFILTLPIVIALVHRQIEELWAQYGDFLRADGASRARAVRELFVIGKTGLVTVFMAAFGRAIAEVGAIIVVGGNIRGYTRTMTTTIALETSKGELALALGLGLILILISVLMSGAAFAINRVTAKG